jgi:hypothetical protein
MVHPAQSTFDASSRVDCITFFSNRENRQYRKWLDFSAFSGVRDFFQNITRLISRVFASDGNTNARFPQEKRPFSEIVFTEVYFRFADFLPIDIHPSRYRGNDFFGHQIQ